MSTLVDDEMKERAKLAYAKCSHSEWDDVVTAVLEAALAPFEGPPFVPVASAVRAMDMLLNRPGFDPDVISSLSIVACEWERAIKTLGVAQAAPVVGEPSDEQARVACCAFYCDPRGLSFDAIAIGNMKRALAAACVQAAPVTSGGWTEDDFEVAESDFFSYLSEDGSRWQEHPAQALRAALVAVEYRLSSQAAPAASGEWTLDQATELASEYGQRFRPGYGYSAYVMKTALDLVLPRSGAQAAPVALSDTQLRALAAASRTSVVREDRRRSARRARSKAMSGYPPSYQVTIYGVPMTLPQASKLTGVPHNRLWRAAQNSCDLTSYIERRKLIAKVREVAAATGVSRDTIYDRLAKGTPLDRPLQKPPVQPSKLRKRARELAAHPDCTVTENCVYMRLRRGWSDTEAMLCAAGSY